MFALLFFLSKTAITTTTTITAATAVVQIKTYDDSEDELTDVSLVVGTNVGGSLETANVVTVGIAVGVAVGTGVDGVTVGAAVGVAGGIVGWRLFVYANASS